jgi:23S rRNA (cytidine1920-2'-O)/16S rRNA (cytidine1409-2'-O)-methyltransferase
MPAEKLRLDHLLVARGLAPTGARAQSFILAGEVYVEGEPATKAGQRYPADAAIELRPRGTPWASRGGGKLAGALDAIGLSVEGLTALDVGASTGGFTDVLLQRGARRVYAIDVGRGLLDWRLRQDARVVVMEGVNGRYLTPADLPEPAHLATIDTSFISLTLIIPAVAPLLSPEGILLPMVKPQFEVGREEIPRGGVVREPRLHEAALRRVVSALYNVGFRVIDAAPSPILGPKGNREFFLHARRSDEMADPAAAEPLIRKAVHGTV